MPLYREHKAPVLTLDRLYGAVQRIERRNTQILTQGPDRLMMPGIDLPGMSPGDAGKKRVWFDGHGVHRHATIAVPSAMPVRRIEMLNKDSTGDYVEKLKTTADRQH